MERYTKLFPIQNFGEKKGQIKISIITNQATAGSGQGKEIVIQLTKDENPLFFYTCRLTEDEFRHIKMQQDLKVDFSSFPLMIIELLESVLKEESKFYLTLDESAITCVDAPSGSRRLGAVLKIVQSAGHKDLTHLALKFHPADSKQIQSYLSDAIVQLKRRVAMLEKQNRQIEMDNKRQCDDLNELLSKKTDEMETLKAETDSAVSKLKEDTEKEKQAVRRALERERAEFEEKYEHLQQENQILSEQLHGSSESVATALQEFQIVKDQVAQLKKQNEDYRRELIDMEKARNDLQMRLESAEDDAESKDNELDDLRERYQALLDQNRRSEHELSEWVNRARHFEDLYGEERGEREKAVEIMQKWTSYSGLYKDKAIKAESFAKKLSDALKRKESELVKLRQEVEQMTKEIVELRQENKSLASASSELRRQAQEKDGVLIEKESTVVNLSKELDNLRLLVNPGAMESRTMGRSSFVTPPNTIDYKASSARSASSGDGRLSFKTPPGSSSNGSSGKENKTPFLHPKNNLSSRT